MRIDLLSFFFGVVLSLAIVIVAENLYGKIFGNKKLNQLNREVRRLKAIVQKKDELIKKSLKTMQEKEAKNEGPDK
ncbi:MAG: hypothetical protein GXO75_13435 [Calditrichaeota bacterium]|nr:hypothetical protein [Calditrichota bacterium]